MTNGYTVYTEKKRREIMAQKEALREQERETRLAEKKQRKKDLLLQQQQQQQEEVVVKVKKSNSKSNFTKEAGVTVSAKSSELAAAMAKRRSANGET